MDHAEDKGQDTAIIQLAECVGVCGYHVVPVQEILMAGRTKHQELLCHALSSQLQSQVCKPLVVLMQSVGLLPHLKQISAAGDGTQQCSLAWQSLASLAMLSLQFTSDLSTRTIDISIEACDPAL